ncbi:hypothetical protein [Catellatospora sp. NPDC049609]|uniref:hypothetical protein n=1 Tax=Catellatospora sp. NPDC049609 TaxID=3155505 RepID=UPI003429BB3D
MAGSSQSLDPLVVAVEGLSYAGKTTLVHALAQPVGGVAVAEYAEMGPLPPFPPRDHHAVIAALAHFLRAECDRTAAGRRAGHPVVLLDRSPLTLITYEFGVATLGVPAAPSYAAELYSQAAELGEVFTPDAYIYLRVSDEVTARRAAVRGPIAAHLSAPSVRAGIERAAAAYLAALPVGRRLELDGSRPLAELLGEAEAFVAALSSQTAPVASWRVLADIHDAGQAHRG